MCGNVLSCLKGNASESASLTYFGRREEDYTGTKVLRRFDDSGTFTLGELHSLISDVSDEEVEVESVNTETNPDDASQPESEGPKIGYLDEELEGSESDPNYAYLHPVPSSDNYQAMSRVTDIIKLSDLSTRLDTSIYEGRSVHRGSTEGELQPGLRSILKHNPVEPEPQAGSSRAEEIKPDSQKTEIPDSFNKNKDDLPENTEEK
ncbi:unnamed protein product [Nezara viridula]|uniref:Uncharacterized protein n=1 Tax=Nezara viridula TaxID=85310 RepID=A0A9P0MLN7_NEZVI|nr:unnamed protein product [Nezara viridula]CAH1397885.1 unnamed protein product [Nezara viridula]